MIFKGHLFSKGKCVYIQRIPSTAADTEVFLWILQNFQEHLCYRTPPVDCLVKILFVDFKKYLVLNCGLFLEVNLRSFFLFIFKKQHFSLYKSIKDVTTDFFSHSVICRYCKSLIIAYKGNLNNVFWSFCSSKSTRKYSCPREKITGKVIYY